MTGDLTLSASGALERLRSAADSAWSGSARVVTIGGETGVGKTHLLRVLAETVGVDEARRGEPDDPDAPMLWQGECLQQGAALLPLAPIITAVDDATRAEALPSGTPITSASGFGMLRSAITARARDRRLLLVIEGVQWADDWTLAFIEYLLRHLGEERILVVLTYRSDELSGRADVRAMLDELSHLDRVESVHIIPCERSALIEALGDLLGPDPDDRVIDRLLTRSDGNPWIARSLVLTEPDGCGRLPVTIRDTHLRRIAQLRPEARSVLQALAIGAPCDEDALRDVTGLGERVSSALHSLRDRDMVTVLDDLGGGLGVARSALRETVLDDLLPGERRELHRRFHDHFSRHVAKPTPDIRRLAVDELRRRSAVARHAAGAGDHPGALAAAMDAARCAEAMADFPAAAHLLENALDRWPAVGDPEEIAGCDRGDLLRRCAEAWSISGERRRSVELLDQALDGELDVATDRVRYAEVLAQQARAYWGLSRPDTAFAFARRALALVGDDDADRPVRVPIRAWLARMLMSHGDSEMAIAEATRALDELDTTDDARLRAELHDTRGVAALALDRIDEGVAALRHAVSISREGPVDQHDQAGVISLAEALHHIGSTDEAILDLQQALRRTQTGHVRNRAWLSLTLSEFAFDAGRWDLARSALDIPPLEVGGPLSIFHALVSAQLALGLGDEDLAATTLDAIAEPLERTAEAQWILGYARARGELSVRRRDLREATDLIATTFERLDGVGVPGWRTAELALTGLRIAAEQAQRARRLRDLPAENHALETAEVMRTRVLTAENGPYSPASARRAQADADHARAEGQPAPERWRAAWRAWAAADRPYRAAIARWREAEALVQSGERGQAIKPVRDARAAAERLGSRWLLDELESLTRRARLVVSTDEPPSGPPADRDDPFGLTAREREVLRLLIEGATNQQIAGALFIAPKTASVHVSRILSKLGVHTRTEAATVAHRMDLDLA